MTVGDKPEGRQPEVGGLCNLPCQLALWQKGRKAGAHRNISASRKAASPQRLTPPQSLCERLAQERGQMRCCPRQAHCRPAPCTAWLPAGCSVHVDCRSLLLAACRSAPTAELCPRYRTLPLPALPPPRRELPQPPTPS